MSIHIIFTVILLIVSLNAIRFLTAYFRLSRSGVKTIGIVVAYDLSNSVMSKNATVPKFRFQTKQDTEITGKPIHSWFFELSRYELGNKYEVIYDKKDPNKFVINSGVELVVSGAVLAGSFIYIVWLMVHFVQL